MQIITSIPAFLMKNMESEFLPVVEKSQVCDFSTQIAEFIQGISNIKTKAPSLTFEAYVPQEKIILIIILKEMNKIFNTALPSRQGKLVLV